MMVSHVLNWTLWMFVCFGQYLSQDLQIPELSTGAEGGTVIFTPENPPSTWTQTTWIYNSETVITTAASGAVIILPDYEGRVRFDSITLALELWNLKLSDSGTYRLSVRTGPGVTITADTSLQVFDIISNVRITHPEETLIEGESSVNITSEGSGIISSVLWMRDNNPLSSGNSITFSSDNRSVSISPVQRSDSGEYQCTYSNPVSSETAKLTLTINHGPDDVAIEGPGVVDLGVQVVLSCFANSEPSASFSWTFNGSDTAVTTDKYTIDKSDFTDSGDYICTAFNRVTNKRESQTHALLVKVGGEGGGSGGGLSGGAIAGIVIGVLVAVGGICGLIVYLTKTKKIPKISLRTKGQASGAQRGQEPELNYADISHFQRNNGDRVYLGDTSETRTEYAEVKRGTQLRDPPPPYGSQVNPAPVRR